MITQAVLTAGQNAAYRLACGYIPKWGSKFTVLIGFGLNSLFIMIK